MIPQCEEDHDDLDVCNPDGEDQIKDMEEKFTCNKASLNKFNNLNDSVGLKYIDKQDCTTKSPNPLKTSEQEYNSDDLVDFISTSAGDEEMLTLYLKGKKNFKLKALKHSVCNSYFNIPQEYPAIFNPFISKEIFAGFKHLKRDMR